MSYLADRTGGGPWETGSDSESWRVTDGVTRGSDGSNCAHPQAQSIRTSVTTTSPVHRDLI